MRVVRLGKNLGKTDEILFPLDSSAYSRDEDALCSSSMVMEPLYRGILSLHLARR